MTLAELKAKYPKAGMTYEPTPGCRRCGGTGEEPKQDLGGFSVGPCPCLCTFVGPELVDTVADGLRETARTIAKEEGLECPDLDGLTPETASSTGPVNESDDPEE
jgi:hypothetical protein